MLFKCNYSAARLNSYIQIQRYREWKWREFNEKFKEITGIVFVDVDGCIYGGGLYKVRIPGKERAARAPPEAHRTMQAATLRIPDRRAVIVIPAVMCLNPAADKPVVTGMGWRGDGN